MTVETKRSDERTVITLSGELNVRSAAQLRVALDESISSSGSVEIEFADVKTADLSLLQLLCSAERTARTSGKKLVIGGEIPDIVIGLFKRTGYFNHGSYSNHECIWNIENSKEAS